MAITVVRAASASSSGANSTLTYAIDGTSGDCLEVGAGLGDATFSSRVVSGVTYAAASLTKVDNAKHGTSGEAWLGYKLAPATGSNNVVVTYSGAAGASDAQHSAALLLSGVDQTIPVGTPAKSDGDSNAQTVTVTSAVGELVIDSGSHGSGYTARGGGQTGIPNADGWININGSSGGGNGAWSYESGAASVVMSWTVVADQWQVVAVSFKPAAGGPPITTEPQTIAVIFGNAASFTVEATGATDYQWTENGANVGSNASSYVTTQTFAADQNARFAVSAWNATGTTQSANAYLRLTIGSGYYVQETVSSDRYTMEDAGGFYVIEPWGGAAAANNLGPFFIGPLNGLGTGGFFFKDRLH